jgi:BirA family biotin operon repressor/biotin-[acetyl-CoA-carboxylase] ligase
MLPLIHLPTTDSTSAHARRLLETAAATPPFVVVATTQSAGRGQFSRAWSSPVGGLWCTFAFPVPARTDALGLRIGLACTRTIDAALRSARATTTVTLKWPNDVYINAKKVLGVLTETMNAPPALLVGVGINANFPSSELLPDLAARATTLFDHTGGPTDLPTLLDNLAANLEHALAAPGLTPGTLAEARARLHAVGKDAEVRATNGDTIRGTLRGLNDQGLPIIDTPAGPVTATSLDPAW